MNTNRPYRLSDGDDLRSDKTKSAGNMFYISRVLQRRMNTNQPCRLSDGDDLRSDKAKSAGNMFYISKDFNAV